MMLRREKFSSQVKLASEVAHELKNPLAIISNALYIARGNLKNDKAEKVDKQLDMIDSAVRRSDRIITDLLGYARMREGSIEASDVHESLDAALSMVLLSDSPPSNVTVSVDKEYDHDLPSLLIDPGQLNQVFINLIRNAIEAMDTTLDWLLSIKTEMDELNRTIVISIQDNGKGITPEDLERVFESFYTTKSMGSGLGLAIVRNIIENYNGTISLVSNIGVGTIVQIRFPLVISSGDGMSGAPIINIS
jgi:two-component system NtrC family sensor kinase